jgi:hypothetical protein
MIRWTLGEKNATSILFWRRRREKNEGLTDRPSQQKAAQ